MGEPNWKRQCLDSGLPPWRFEFDRQSRSDRLWRAEAEIDFAEEAEQAEEKRSVANDSKKQHERIRPVGEYDVCSSSSSHCISGDCGAVVEVPNDDEVVGVVVEGQEDERAQEGEQGLQGGEDDAVQGEGGAVDDERAMPMIQIPAQEGVDWFIYHRDAQKYMDQLEHDNSHLRELLRAEIAVGDENLAKLKRVMWENEQIKNETGWKPAAKPIPRNLVASHKAKGAWPKATHKEKPMMAASPKCPPRRPSRLQF